MYLLLDACDLDLDLILTFLHYYSTKMVLL